MNKNTTLYSSPLCQASRPPLLTKSPGKYENSYTNLQSTLTTMAHRDWVSFPIPSGSKGCIISFHYYNWYEDAQTDPAKTNEVSQSSPLTKKRLYIMKFDIFLKQPMPVHSP